MLPSSFSRPVRCNLHTKNDTFEAYAFKFHLILTGKAAPSIEPSSYKFKMAIHMMNQNDHAENA